MYEAVNSESEEETEETEEGVENFIPTKSINCENIESRQCTWKEEVFCEYSCGICEN